MGTNNIFSPEFSNDADVMLDDANLGQPKGATAALQGKHTIAVRPEYLRLSPVREGSNGLVGTVDFVRLLGASIETELSVGDRSFVHTMVSDRAPEFAVGQQAEIHFDFDHAWVIPS
jgi:putative spermidine/putrescine transport system ATP-binding protein